eukprot:2495842-Amphidinium_carterae.1
MRDGKGGKVIYNLKERQLTSCDARLQSTMIAPAHTQDNRSRTIKALGQCWCEWFCDFLLAEERLLPRRAHAGYGCMNLEVDKIWCAVGHSQKSGDTPYLSNRPG